MVDPKCEIVKLNVPEKIFTRFGKLLLRQSSTWQTYYHTYFHKGWFNQIEIRVKFTQEITYHKLLS